MKFVNVTHNHRKMVQKQLDNTDAHLVQVYSAGNTTFIYEEAKKHSEILIVNRTRNVREDEIEQILDYLAPRLKGHHLSPERVQRIDLGSAVELTIDRV
jgi:transcriptional antiterminator